MQKRLIILPLILSLSLVSCGKDEEIAESNKQPASIITEATGITVSTGILTSPQITKTSETWLVPFQIGDKTWTLSLPNNIWWKKEEIQSQQFILANNGWNGNTDLKTPPEWTNNTPWGVSISNSSNGAYLYVADINTVLGEMKKNNYKTGKTIDDSDMYMFGFEGAWNINISLMESLQKDGISNLPREELDRELVAWISQPEKKVYSIRDIKNKKGEIIGYGSACSFSQDPENTFTFNSYCILTFDGKYVKSYTYQIPEKFIEKLSTDVITSKYYADWNWEKYINSDFYKETTKFWKKMFDNLYANKTEFKEYIDTLDWIAINNFISQ